MTSKAGATKTNRRTLRATGMRVTNQRTLVMDIIRRGQGHLDADEIYRKAREKGHQLSLSTVYRALQRFKKLDLVEELHFDEDHHHYEVKPSAEHHHLVCLGCGRVVEFHNLLSRYINKNVPEAKEFEIFNTELRMTGYCPSCRKGRK